MATPLIRATFGRLSNVSIARITIGHISVNGEDTDTIRRRRGGKAGTNKQIDPKVGVKFRPFIDRTAIQIRKEDNELIELVLLMIEGDMI